MMSCQDLGSNLPEPPPKVPLPATSEVAPGVVAVKFVKLVTQSEADVFIRGLNLVPIHFSGPDRDATLLGKVGVPIGKKKPG